MEKFEDNIRIKDVKEKVNDMKLRVKDEEDNEVKSEEMVPDWIWGGENNFSHNRFFIILILGEDPANVSMPVKELVFTEEKTVKNYQISITIQSQNYLYFQSEEHWCPDNICEGAENLQPRKNDLQIVHEGDITPHW